MIASIKLYDLIPSRISPCKPYSTHCRLCPRIYHPDHLNRWNHIYYQLSHPYLELCWCTKACSIFSNLFYCIYYIWMGMSKDKRTPGADIVYVSISIFIPYVASLPPIYEWRKYIYCLSCPDRAVYSTWYEHLCFFK